MRSFVKSTLLAGLGIGCLALGSGAQQPAPTPPAFPTAPVPAAAPRVYVTGQSAEAFPGYAGRFATTADGTAVMYTIGVDTESVKLAKQIAEAKSDTDKEKLKEKLKESLNKAFDERQKRQEKEIEALEAQVKKLKEMVSKRQEAKNEIISDRIKQLEREAKGLGW